MALAEVDAGCSLHLDRSLSRAVIFACNFTIIALGFFTKAVQKPLTALHPLRRMGPYGGRNLPSSHGTPSCFVASFAGGSGFA